MNLSKSRYTSGVQCPKMLWMRQHMPEQFDESVMNQAVLETGNKVGDLAMGYYGDFVEVPFKADDFESMLECTQQLLAAGTRNICEATFSYEGCLCMVDILRVEQDGVRIVEVKSSTHVNEIYLHDMAFQTWVLKMCGLNVKSVGLMHINNSYVREGELDLQQLFTVEDCTSIVLDMLGGVEQLVPQLKAIADQETEPQIGFGQQCNSPYECGFRGWCWRNVAKPSVFDLNRMSIKKGMELLDEGVVTFEDAQAAGIKLNARQQAQVRCELQGEDVLIDRKNVAKFLDSLTFPLYFLDFETFQPTIPPFDGVKPFQQIPTQYSLHVLRAPSAQLEHYEFLAEAGEDPRRSVAEHLVADIPAGACTLAYNMSFEKGRIKEMAAAFPDLSEQLMGIHNGIKDLIVPFNRGWYYARAMGKSNSIKAVLPALFPDDPELDYHALEGVHNGSEASASFENLVNMQPEEAAVTREQLLRYCELDTLAMVRIWQKLREAVGLE